MHWQLLSSAAIVIMTTLSVNASSNENLKQCIEQHNFTGFGINDIDWNLVSKCQSKYRSEARAQQRKQLSDFLEANPRYRYAGQSLNRCWGKPREMPFEKSTLTVGPKGMEASVWYKDKIPAGCFETKPWDNRDG